MIASSSLFEDASSWTLLESCYWHYIEIFVQLCFFWSIDFWVMLDSFGDRPAAIFELSFVELFGRFSMSGSLRTRILFSESSFYLLFIVDWSAPVTHSSDASKLSKSWPFCNRLGGWVTGSAPLPHWLFQVYWEVQTLVIRVGLIRPT